MRKSKENKIQKFIWIFGWPWEVSNNFTPKEGLTLFFALSRKMKNDRHMHISFLYIVLNNKKFYKYSHISSLWHWSSIWIGIMQNHNHFTNSMIIKQCFVEVYVKGLVQNKKIFSIQSIYWWWRQSFQVETPWAKW